MNTIGFVISSKENEKRRALLPRHIQFIKNKNHLFFEKGYGESLGFSDQDYLKMGVNIVSRDEALSKNYICDPKVGDADYLNYLKKGQGVFGWVHAVQNKSVTDILLKREITAIAWEDMDYMGKHVFWRNNELAGEAAILHAFTLFGKSPYDCKVALLGRGNIARGAYKILSALGAEVIVYDKKSEGLLREEISNYDVIVNGVLWDIYRQDHIIYKDDLIKMKKPAMIVDISCDKAGAIETSIPTSIENPTYNMNGVLHYVVDHTPALLSHTVSNSIGDELINYIDYIIDDLIDENKVLVNAKILESGRILDSKIIDYQIKL